MPDSRNGRAWFPMLVALLALLAFAPQAAATDYDDERDGPVACTAHDDDEYEDECSDDDDPPLGCVAGDYEHEDSCSDDDEEVDEPESDDDESEEEPESESNHSESDDDVRSCEDGPVARGARGSEDGVEDGCLPHFVRRFITRVWKFVGEVDYYEEGVLSMTMHKILNLPRKWREQDDDLIDGDTTVLVSERVRVFQDGERVGQGALDAANDVRVHGKLLRPFKWLEDEDGEAVPTIRAKKVYVTG